MNDIQDNGHTSLTTCAQTFTRAPGLELGVGLAFEDSTIPFHEEAASDYSTGQPQQMDLDTVGSGTAVPCFLTPSFHGFMSYRCILQKRAMSSTRSAAVAAAFDLAEQLVLLGSQGSILNRASVISAKLLFRLL